MAEPKVVKNFMLFIDGLGYAGRVEEVTEPDLALKTEELRAGGMDAPIDVDLGMEMIKFTFTLAEHDARVYRLFGRGGPNAPRVELRQALADSATVTPKIITAQGLMKSIKGGGTKAGDKGKLEVEMTCPYYRMTMGGVTEVEIDVMNFKRVIGGVDQLAEQRAALGL